MKTIVDYLRSWRSANGFTQDQVADSLSVSQSTYNKWESGKRAVPPRQYANIAKVIGMRLSVLVPDGVTAEVKGLQKQSDFKLDVKDFLNLLEDNNGLLKLRCERLEAENKLLKAENQQLKITLAALNTNRGGGAKNNSNNQ